MPKFIHKYKQLTDRISYEDAKKNIPEGTLKYHLGQMKLLLSEVFFLLKYHNEENILVLYVGAADGYHTHYMARMFPQYKFHLYDKRDFHKIYTDEPQSNIELYHMYFTDEDAKYYSTLNYKILFMCDMRDLDIRTEKLKTDSEGTDNLVLNDMNLQMGWAKTMTPLATYLKFRLPYYQDTVDYFDGSIYLQPYSPLSTETRLLITNYDKMKTYNCKENDEKMAYFNCCIRHQPQNTKWNNIMKKHNIYINWDNTYALYVLEDYLKKKNNNQPTEEEVIKLFLDVVKYHSQSNEKKYSIIFNKN
jgi:hypothetical protein